jgi:hypothetical protein
VGRTERDFGDLYAVGGAEEEDCLDPVLIDPLPVEVIPNADELNQWLLGSGKAKNLTSIT